MMPLLPPLATSNSNHNDIANGKTTENSSWPNNDNSCSTIDKRNDCKRLPFRPFCTLPATLSATCPPTYCGSRRRHCPWIRATKPNSFHSWYYRPFFGHSRAFSTTSFILVHPICVNPYRRDPNYEPLLQLLSSSNRIESNRIKLGLGDALETSQSGSRRGRYKAKEILPGKAPPFPKPKDAKRYGQKHRTCLGTPVVLRPTVQHTRRCCCLIVAT